MHLSKIFLKNFLIKMSVKTIQIEADLIEEVLKVAKKVSKYRKIESYAAAAREAFIFYIKQNDTLKK